MSRQDEQLDDLINIVGSLKEVNKDIGTTLVRQNKMLEGMNSKLDSNQSRMDKVNNKLERIQRR